MVRVLLFISLAITLVSCDGSTEEIFTVTNSSSSELTLIFETPYLGTDSIQYILPGEEKVVAYFSLRGGIEKPKSAVVFDSIGVFNDTDTLQYNLAFTQDWTTITIQESKFPSSYKHSHSVTIIDDNF